MALYTFNLFNLTGASSGLEVVEAPDDGASFTRAGELLETHPSCDHVEVWQDDRAVVARYRLQPVIRPVPADPA